MDEKEEEAEGERARVEGSSIDQDAPHAVA